MSTAQTQGCKSRQGRSGGATRPNYSARGALRSTSCTHAGGCRSRAGRAFGPSRRMHLGGWGQIVTGQGRPPDRTEDVPQAAEEGTPRKGGGGAESFPQDRPEGPGGPERADGAARCSGHFWVTTRATGRRQGRADGAPVRTRWPGPPHVTDGHAHAPARGRPAPGSPAPHPGAWFPLSLHTRELLSPGVPLLCKEEGTEVQTGQAQPLPRATRGRALQAKWLAPAHGPAWGQGSRALRDPLGSAVSHRILQHAHGPASQHPRPQGRGAQHGGAGNLKHRGAQRPETPLLGHIQRTGNGLSSHARQPRAGTAQGLPTDRGRSNAGATRPAEHSSASKNKETLHAL